MIILKSKKEINLMNEANKIVHEVLNYVEENITSGITTKDLENIALEKLGRKALPIFKGYLGFPATICISINDEVVHGIPGNKIIKDGDIVSVDFGVIYKGFVGDAARTFIIGSAQEEVIKLVHNTKEALKLGIDQMRAGNRIYDIGKAISAVAKINKYGVVKNYCGHGIGSAMHEDPHVFNYVNLKESNIILREGMVFALEPMFNLGTSDVKVLSDDWTVVTKDNKPSAHWEVSVAITPGEPHVLGAS